jgi:LysM repeat protein
MTINETIESYRKRRNRLMPLILGGVAILLVIVGIIIVVASMRGGGIAKLLATKTTTPTITPLPTDTPTITETPTITLTPTLTSTVTPSAPENYIVQEGDNLTSIIKAKNLGENALLLIYSLNPLVKDPATGKTTGIDPANGFITVGQTIILPNPGMQLPTSTPIPTGLAPGTRITYNVLPGDSLGSIANKFLSTVDQIVLANKTLLTKGSSTVIQPGWTLVVPINLVTAVPTKATTATPTATATAKP